MMGIGQSALPAVAVEELAGQASEDFFSGNGNGGTGPKQPGVGVKHAAGESCM